MTKKANKSREIQVGDLVTWGQGVTSCIVLEVTPKGVMVDAESIGFPRCVVSWSENVRLAKPKRSQTKRSRKETKRVIVAPVTEGKGMTWTAWFSPSKNARGLDKPDTLKQLEKVEKPEVKKPIPFKDYPNCLCGHDRPNHGPGEETKCKAKSCWCESYTARGSEVSPARFSKIQAAKLIASKKPPINGIKDGIRVAPLVAWNGEGVDRVFLFGTNKYTFEQILARYKDLVLSK
jgi:hypothetical protein